MVGRPVGFSVTPAPEKIPSHDATPIERVADALSGAEREIVAQLRELGYVE